MTQIIINVEDQSLLPHLTKMLEAIQGISIAKTSKKGKNGIEEALDDIRKGRVTHCENVDDMFKQILGI